MEASEHNEGTPPVGGTEGTEPGAAPEAPPVEGADEQPAEGSADPAPEQSPVATETDEQNRRIVGDQGARPSEGSPTSKDIPHSTSGPPPSAQSGTPFPEEGTGASEEDPQGD